MKTLTIRIPDEKHDRLKHLAESQGISINKLIEELSTIALTEFDRSAFYYGFAWQCDPDEY